MTWNYCIFVYVDLTAMQDSVTKCVKLSHALGASNCEIFSKDNLGILRIEELVRIS